MILENRKLILSISLHIALVSMYFFDIKTEFGYILLWLIPLYFMALFCDSKVNTMLVFLHGLVLSNKYSGLVIDTNHMMFYSLVFSLIIVLAYKCYGFLYNADDITKYISVFVAAFFGNFIVFYVGLIGSNYDYIIDNIGASLYSGVAAAVLSYVYRSISDDESKSGV